MAASPEPSWILLGIPVLQATCAVPCHHPAWASEAELPSSLWATPSTTLPLSQPQDQITITGYEKNTEAAREAILKIVGELEQMVSEDVPLDHRVHARIIGARGKAIRKIMDEFKVTCPS